MTDLRILRVVILLGLLPATTAGAQPANDDCVGAELIECGDVVLGSTVGVEPDVAPTCVVEDSIAGGVWYRFIGTGDLMVISTCGGTDYFSRLRVYSGDCGNLQCITGDDNNICPPPQIFSRARVSWLAEAGVEYRILVHGQFDFEGDYEFTVECIDATPFGGPDVIYSDCTSTANWGTIGGVRGYSLDSFTCNIGDLDLPWGGNSPLLATNAYRLMDGRLEQIGMAWVKNGVSALALDACGGGCNGQGISVLGAGCQDIYGAAFNGGQGILGPRSEINAFTGQYGGASGAATNLLSKRLQIAEVDLALPGATYFLEGVYVAGMDAAFGNAGNNASYTECTVDPSTFDLTPVGDMQVGDAAIFAWSAADPSVEVSAIDVPGEGRFYVASRVTDLGAGQWRYEYAIHNLNSHRSAGSFTLPFDGATITATGVGFHDVDYHTGEPFDSTDWSATVGPSGITWSSPATFAENPNSNALRFATMYSFWFDADDGPGFALANIGLFRPGTPDSISVAVTGPGGAVGANFIRGDGDGDGTFNGLIDGLYLLDFQFQSGPAPLCFESSDCDGDGVFNGLLDGLYALQHQFQGGPAPGAPYPSCGQDPDPGNSLGCGINACP